MSQKFIQERLRNDLEQEYITKIREDISNMPNEYNKDIEIIEVDTTLLNSWNKDNLLDIKNDNYLNQKEFKIIDKSCIGICKDSKRLLWYFITNEDDKAIDYCLKDAEEVIEGLSKYCPKKMCSFYSGFSSKKRKKDYIKTEKDFNKYSGHNWLDGLQNFFCKFKDSQKGNNYIAYYKMKKQGQEDTEWRYKKERLYSILYHLEKRYLPEYANYRLELLNNSYCKGIMPKDLNPATCMGASKNFSSSFHKDSSVKGTMETIIWTGAKNNKKQIFVNGAGYYFNINKNSLIFQVGTDYHGTANTGDHGGYGFVNLSKKNLLLNTEHQQKLYNNLYNNQ
jgi:hypothetical protein